MAGAEVKVFHTTSDRLSKLPVVDGQVIFVTDQPSVHLDINSMRVDYNLMTTFQNDKERLDVAVPMQGFYYVVDTNVLWHFMPTLGWVQITRSATSNVYFGGKDTFPEVGDEHAIYSDDEGIYRWDKVANTYSMISNVSNWIDII